MTKNTCLVLATDIYFLDQMQVLLKSVSAHYNGSEKLNVVVLVPRELLSKQNEILRFANLDISFRYPEELDDPEVQALASKMYKNANFTSASMYRYFMGGACAEFDKAIYIDIDCVIARDIQPLLDFELINAPIAALHEMHLEHLNNPAFKDSAYFNAGVLVVDLNRWREQETTKKLLETSKTFTNWTGSADQDILNVVFRNNWTPLNINFNYLVNIYPGLKIFDPIVVHFAGKSKPWINSTKTNVWKELWNHYRTTT
jgi:lipopolysaccharide biosynthesis glycosyltransferase